MHANAAPRKRVLFLINSLVSGGAERVMCTLLAASEQERATYDIELALLDREPPVYTPPDWVRVHQLNCRNSLPRSIIAARDLFARQRPDIVLSFLTRANIAAIAGARMLAIPCVISERVQNSAHLGDGLSAVLAKQAIRFSYPHAERIIAVSEGVANDLEDAFGVPKAKTIVVNNPIDAAAISRRAVEPAPLAIEGPYIVSVGRLTSVKNFALLIEAFKSSAYQGKLLIIGEGPERARLEQQIRDADLAGRVMLPGYLENPFPLIKRADMFVSPSNAEGFPNALVEAMALGAPVISTNCPSGPAEILANTGRHSIKGLTEGAFGILTPTDDAPALARAIDTLLDPAVRTAWGAKARTRVADFSVERAKDSYWAVLREVMAHSSAASNRAKVS